MSSFISGPVIAFQVDTSAVDQEIKKIYATAAQQAKAMQSQLVSAAANPLQQQAAKLRALYSTGAIGIKDLQVEQKKFLGLLDNEISRLVQKNNLTKQELSTLKQVTLERERQANALSRGVGVGVTSGTQSALSLVSAPIIANLSRIGALFGGIQGGSDLVVGAQGISTALQAITVSGGGAIGVLGGLTAAALAAGTALAASAISGGNLAERLSNISQRTGIPIKDLQVLEAVAKTSELSLDDIVIGFKKFSQALTGGGGEGDGVEGATKTAVQSLKILGVTAKDPFTALEQLAEAFQKIPDGALKIRTSNDLLGKSGINLINFLNQGKDGIEKLRAEVEKYGPTITAGALKSQNDWEIATGKLDLAFQKLKVDAIPVLDILTKIATAAADFINHPPPSPSDVGAKAGEATRQALIGIYKDTVSLLSGGSGVSNQNSIAGSAQAANTQVLVLDSTFNKFSGTLRALGKNYDGTAEAARKLHEEGVKELQALNEEASKRANDIIQQATESSRAQGLSPERAIIQKELDDIQKIADALDQVQNKTEELALKGVAAIDAIIAATFRDLTKLEEDSFQKATEATDKILEEEQKRQSDIGKIILDAEDQLAIDRAAASQNGIAKIRAEEQKRLDDTISKAAALGATEEQLQKIRVTLNQDADAQIAKLRSDELKKTQDEIKNSAGQLFDSLVSGTKNFGQVLRQTLLAAALTPVKILFQAVIAAIFTPIVQRVKDALTALGKSLQGKGGILGKIGDILVPKDSETKGNTVATGTNTTATNANTDALAALTQALQGLGGVGSGSAGAGNQLFGSLGFVPPGGVGAPSTSGIQGNSGGFFGAALRGASAGLPGILLGLGNVFGGKNLGVKIGGGVTAAGGAISGIAAGLNNKTLGALGAVGQGAGLVISGVSQGGVKGTAEAALGGAQIGTAIAPGIGTLIGAAAGAFAGILGSIFGHHGPSAADIQKAITKQTVDSSQFTGVEFDRSAQGTFGQTLNSGFLEGPGGNFSSFLLRGEPRQASVVNHININAVDAKSVQQLFSDNGNALGQVVAAQAGSVRTGLGRAVRQVVHPA